MYKRPTTQYHGEMDGGKNCDNRDQKNDVENDEKYYGRCEKCCDAGRGNIEHVDILQGVAEGCTSSPNIFEVHLVDLIVAVEAATQGDTVAEDTVSGLMCSDYSVGISETLEVLRKQAEKALEYTRKWRMTANVKKCAVVVCNEIR